MKTITNLNINQLNLRTLGELSTSKYDKKKGLTIHLSEYDFKRLKTIAFINETAMSEIVQAFLKQFLEQYSKENVIEPKAYIQNERK